MSKLTYLELAERLYNEYQNAMLNISDCGVDDWSDISKAEQDAYAEAVRGLVEHQHVLERTI